MQAGVSPELTDEQYESGDGGDLKGRDDEKCQLGRRLEGEEEGEKGRGGPYISVNDSSLSRDLKSDSRKSSSETLKNLAHDDLE